MTREEAKIFLCSIADDLGFTDIENYTCKDGEKMREAIKTLSQEPCDYTGNEFFNFDAPMVKKSMEQDAISRLDKIRQIIAIPNSVIQEDVMKYKMICEVMNDDKSVS